MEIDPTSGNIMKTYIYGNSEILAQHTGKYDQPRYFYLHDRLGSVRQIINQSGSVEKYYTFEPFGKTLEEGGTFGNPFLFTGQWFDSEINEYYLRARQYDPHIARFTSRDPVKGKLKEPLTLHKYLYCMNDPMNNTDPSGASAKALVAPVVAGYATHALAIAFVAYGVANDRDFAIALGIAIERSISGVMVLVGIGVNYWDALIHEVKQKDRDNFGRLKQIGEKYGKTLDEVRDAIHRNKKYYRPDGGDLTEEEIEEILEHNL